MDLEESRIPEQQVGGTTGQQVHLVEGCMAHWRLEVFPEEVQEDHRTFLFSVVERCLVMKWRARPEALECFSVRGYFATTWVLHHFISSLPNKQRVQ